MRNFYASLVLAYCPVAMAQLHVSPNGFIYARDQVVYVTQNVSLNPNASFLLRGEAQLLQGTTGSSSNLGAGRLSVYQEGTSDNFDYNYWCSPVGNASAGTGNQNFGVTMLNSPQNSYSSNAAVIMGAGVLNGIASPLSIASGWIYKYINSNNYSQWVLVGGATSIAPGEGFTMKGTSGIDATSVEGVANNPGGAQRYDFRGKPNDGNITVAVGLNNQTLTGNPYPSALHVNAFLLDPTNIACDGIAYYWEQNKSINSHFLAQYQGGYGTYSPISLGSNGIYVAATFNTYDGSGNLNTTGTSSGLVIERKYAPIGQGFMVKGAANGTVTLRNSHREFYRESWSLSQFERSAEHSQTGSGDVSHLRINTILPGDNTRQLALAFVEGATDGHDRGIDARTPAEESLPNDSFLVMDDNRYVILGTEFAIDKRIPLGVTSAGQVFKFYLADAVQFPESQNVFLYDAQTSTYHDLRDGITEIFVPAGLHIDRFEITFVDAALSVPGQTSAALAVMADDTSEQLLIRNPGNLALGTFSLFDLTGKRVSFRSALGDLAEAHVSLAGLSEGVYLCRIEIDGKSPFITKVPFRRQ